MQRRDFLLLAAGAGVVAGGLLTRQFIADKVPRKTADGKSINIILISIDCLNQRQLAEALQSRIVPHSESFSSDAWVFSRCHAHAPWTTPSHMSMLTGLYPHQHGREIPYLLVQDKRVLYDRLPTFASLADVLAGHGYETMAITGNGSVSARYGLGQGFKRYLESMKNKKNSDLSQSTAHVTNWIGSRNREQPFFLFFHTFDFHAPLALADSSKDNETNMRTCLSHIDAGLGQLFTQLKEADCYDSSLIFLTGDHGSVMIETDDKCCYHGAGHYEENLKVPLLVKLPGSTTTGPEDRLARHVDIFPTVIDCLGLNPEAYNGPGISLLRRLKNDGAAGVPEVSYSTADAYWQVRCALVTEKHKYIYTPRNLVNRLLPRIEVEHDRVRCKSNNQCCSGYLEEFYEIASDPFEHNDFLRSEKGDGSVLALRNDFRTEMVRYLNMPVAYQTVIPAAGSGAPGQTEQPLQDREHLEALRALGYIR